MSQGMNGPDPFAGFDPMKHNPSTGGGGKSLPISGAEGHVVVIFASRVKNIKDATQGSMVEFDLRIMDGQSAGVEGSWRLNIGHVKKQTQDIAMEQVTSLTRVLGFRTLMTNSQQLYNKPFRAVVDLQKGQVPGAADYKGYTDVVKVLDINGLEASDPNAGMSAPAGPAPGQVAAVPTAAPAPVVAPVVAPVAAVAPVVGAPEQVAFAPQPAVAPVAAIAPVATPAPAIAPVAAVPPIPGQPVYTAEQLAAMQAQLQQAPMGAAVEPAGDKPSWMT